MKTEIPRYVALLRVCDMAWAHASATQADGRPEFFETLAAALTDDCPQQSAKALRMANHLRMAEAAREDLLASLQSLPPEAAPTLL